MYNPRDLNALYLLMRKHRLSALDFEAAAATELAHLTSADLGQLRLYLREALGEIGDYFATMVDPTRLNAVPTAELKAWLKDNYEWMEAETLEMAYKDGLQYAAA